MMTRKIQRWLSRHVWIVRGRRPIPFRQVSADACPGTDVVDQAPVHPVAVDLEGHRRRSEPTSSFRTPERAIRNPGESSSVNVALRSFRPDELVYVLCRVIRPVVDERLQRFEADLELALRIFLDPF